MRKLLALIGASVLLFTVAACDPPPVYTVHEGTFTTSHDGQVVTGVEVRGDIQVNHDNVTLHHFRMVGGHLTVNPETAEGTVIEDCELDGGGDPGTQPAVMYARFELRRCHIHGFGEGPMGNGDVIIEGNVIHDFVDYEHEQAHQDAIQVVCGDNIVIRDNWLDNDAPVANAAIMVGTACGPVNNVLIEGNVVAGGGWAIYAGSAEDWPGDNATNVVIRNNKFGTWHHNRSGWAGPLVNYWGATVEDNTVLDGPYAGQDFTVLYGIPQ